MWRRSRPRKRTNSFRCRVRCGPTPQSNPMAVYTDVAADELADFLSHYELGELLSYKGIAEGVENSNFLLHTSAGHFILTLYEKRVAKGELRFFLGLMRSHCSRASSSR